MHSNSVVILVEPNKFYCNPLTQDNYFQSARYDSAGSDAAANTVDVGIQEHRQFIEQLRKPPYGVRTVTFRMNPDTAQAKPDAIFPNNSFSVHCMPNPKSGRLEEIVVVLYPMSPGRRDEIPPGLSNILKAPQSAGHLPLRVVDLRGLQAQEQYLEGTGAINFSHDQHALFVGRSLRASEAALQQFVTQCSEALQITDVYVFDIFDNVGRPIYHTNVAGFCGQRSSAWCLDALRFTGADESCVHRQTKWGAAAVHRTQSDFMQYFANAGIPLIPLTFDEMNKFCGNCFELKTMTESGDGRHVLTLSHTAWEGLQPDHRDAFTSIYGKDNICVGSIPTIERLGGGSIRCLQAVAPVCSPCKEDVERAVKQIEAWGSNLPSHC